MDVSRAHARTRRILLSLTAGACAAVLVGGCSSGGDAAGPERSTRAAAPRSANELEDDYRAVIKDVLPSVVQIDAANSLGSGVVYDDKGHVVTNAHVVGQEKSFKVTAATGGQPVTARLVASYPEQDLAVIRLENVPQGLKAARFGDSSTVDMGQIVLAMGSPLGLSGSVTQGIVSATGRTVSEGRAGGGTGATIGNMVQTSAAINPGNSGGALVNLDGEVVGIPTLAASDPEMGGGSAPGIGFAIPASMVRTVADQIVKDGKVTDSGRAALNITGRTVLDDDYEPAGVAVVEAPANGAAGRAGLKPGDVITRLGDTGITTITSLSEALASRKPGEKVQVTYVRGTETEKTEVTLGEM
ncbi:MULTISPECIES: trypsin-like peptidase domain-containing protein [unclassified Streptomyces]|uniref:trypsin-like peptidase domain-containing protein n=1 Tax=unclassified Streptomyces TaxID=2593676 RepID=UPI0006AE1606|nr:MULTISPECIES: trypsin-like peptidase domain-containing protein [unclassified Streptomyces]KOX37433.1 signal protein PDZ [Streptomyces sp. NRRL F-6491]KOX52096.1 signal protein PDZ [Streptomyces sp. NRRL F-6492]